MTCSEVILLYRIQQRNVLQSHFTVCEKIRWQVEESRDEDEGLQEWRIRNVLLKTLHLSTCYTFPSPAEFLLQYRIQCAPLHAECGVIPFYQLLSRALPERALISKWSGCKTGLAHSCYSYFLTQYPCRGYCVKKVVSLPSLHMCRHLSQRPLQIVQRAFSTELCTLRLQEFN